MKIRLKVSVLIPLICGLVIGLQALGNGGTAAVTNEESTITGTYIGPGAECPQFRLNDGEKISLSGAVPDAEIGEALTLAGRWSMLSKCMQGREFRVFKRLEGQEDQ